MGAYITTIKLRFVYFSSLFTGNHFPYIRAIYTFCPVNANHILIKIQCITLPQADTCYKSMLSIGQHGLTLLVFVNITSGV